MIWKDAHSKLSEEKHIAKQCGIVMFLFKKKKIIPTGIYTEKHLEICTPRC